MDFKPIIAEPSAVAGIFENPAAADENATLCEAVPGSAPGEIQIPAHRLLRPIGQGSYGTVWLAINSIGTYRAIKTVYRHHFEEEHPYEREYEGIKNFEPISRTHEGFVDILQVERNDEGGYFYYVMELADDLARGQEIVPEKYIAKTLAEACPKSCQLPLNECLKIGNSLASTLEFLHGNGLVHRDIKATNIVFINGRPKLADIGLVDDIRCNSTFVGTPGFIPPEGPGAPAADIYSLGKVLYEISTGQDRTQFPLLPGDSPLEKQSPAFQDWYSILLKASAENVTLRYRSATELQAHLALVRAGKSVKHLLQFERSIALAKRFGPLILLVLLLVPLVAFEIIREKRRTAEERQRRSGSYAAYGSRAFSEGHYLSGLRWFVQALELDSGKANIEPTHRLRIGSALQQSPRLIAIQMFTNFWSDAKFGRTRNEVLSRLEGRFAIWDIRTGERISPFFGNGNHWEEKCSFSRDYRRAVTANADTRARVWDIATGQMLREFQHPGWVLSAHFSPDGRRIVTTENGVNEARVWDVDSGEQVLFLEGHTNHLSYADFSPDGRLIVTATEKGQVILWDETTGERRLVFTNHTYWVQSAAFSPDSKRVATTSGDHTALLWEAETGRELLPVLEHKDHVLTAEFSPDGKWLLTACLDGSAHIWDTNTGQHAFPILNHQTRIKQASWSPDGTRVLTLSIDGSVFIWELRFPAVAPLFNTVAFSGNGLRRAQLNADKIEITASLDSNSVVSIPIQGARVSALQLDSEAKRLLVHSAALSPIGTETITAWNLASAKPAGLSITADSPLTNIILSSDGGRIAGCTASKVLVWNAATGAKLFEIPGVHTDMLAFDHTGKRLAVGRGNKVDLWDLTGSLEHLLARITVKLNVSHIEFSPNDDSLLTSSFDQTLRAGSAQIWSTDTGSLAVPEMSHRDGVLYAAFSPNGDHIISCGEDFVAYFWDSRTGERLSIPPLVHQEQVAFAAFSRNNLWVLTVEGTGTIRVWDAFTGELVMPPLRQGAQIVSAQFISGDQAIATKRADGGVNILKLPRDPRPIKDLVLIAQLLSGQQMDLQRTASEPEELRSTWEYLRSRYPRDFSVGH
jgi:WD40 repeat protein